MPAPPLARATFLWFPPASGFCGPMRQAPRERQQPAGVSGADGLRAAAPQVAEPGAPLRSPLLGLGGSLSPAGFAAGLHCPGEGDLGCGETASWAGVRAA